MEKSLSVTNFTKLVSRYSRNKVMKGNALNLMMTGEILVTEFPCVEPDAPAIQVAGEMTRYGASRCYVREGGRLVGVVELPRFLSKIFRE